MFSSKSEPFSTERTNKIWSYKGFLTVRWLALRWKISSPTSHRQQGENCMVKIDTGFIFISMLLKILRIRCPEEKTKTFGIRDIPREHKSPQRTALRDIPRGHTPHKWTTLREIPREIKLSRTECQRSARRRRTRPYSWLPLVVELTNWVEIDQPTLDQASSIRRSGATGRYQGSHRVRALLMIIVIFLYVRVISEYSRKG